jgi:4-amino-4-deoxy-L-arabinose transferase-like glycosyltransferase
MSATAALRTRPAVAISGLVAPIGLYAVALVARLAVIFIVPFTLTEGSAYYVDVARNIAAGRGPVIDALWSYVTPPLTIPRPAFELWQPLASYVASVPMHFLGSNLATAQLAFAVSGAFLAPLAWLIARDAAQRLDLPANRATAVAVASGLLVGIGAPFILAAAAPDSTLPFTVLATAACLVMPSAARGDRRALAALGIVLGLAYLTRMEAIYLGDVFVFFAWRANERRLQFARVVGAVVLIGALVAVPWWLRNYSVFGTPLPGQLAQNVFLSRNEQIFAFTTQPSLSSFVAQGLPTIAGNVVAAAWHNFFSSLLIPGTVLSIGGAIALVIGRSRRRELRMTPLAALLAYGAVAFVVTSVVFPVATLWGTFDHAAGPVFVALTVAAVIGGDAFVARVRRWRGWERPNVWMAPAGLAALTLTMTLLQLGFVAAQTAARERQVEAAAATVRATLRSTGAPVITDHPIWLSDELGVPALALPDEHADSVLALARKFGATGVVVLDSSQRNVDGLVNDPRGCFVPQPVAQIADTPPLAVLAIKSECQ